MKKFYRGVAAALCLAIVLAAPVEVWSACKKCASASACGGPKAGKDSGWANVAACQGQAKNASCDHCAGTAAVRNCIGSVQPNTLHCVKPEVAPTCGAKSQGTCQAFDLPGGLGKSKYCKKSGTTSGTCEMASACIGTEED